MDIVKLCKWINRLKIRDMIKKWELRIYIEDNILYINYIAPKIDKKYQFPLSWLLLSEMQKRVSGYLIDIYYEYERDWQPMTIEWLSKVMCMSISSTHNTLNMILKKIKDNKWMLDKVLPIFRNIS